MKKFLIKPIHLVAAIVILLAVVAGGVYAYQQWNSPYRGLPAAEREYREKQDTLDTCLKEAQDREAERACLEKYPDV